jgi:NADH:ubiquinone oxidoreductase subunit 3 (subunit A)
MLSQKKTKIVERKGRIFYNAGEQQLRNTHTHTIISFYTLALIFMHNELFPLLILIKQSREKIGARESSRLPLYNRFGIICYFFVLF